MDLLPDSPQQIDREVIVSELQGVLVTLIDLSLIGKHAHWNVVGPHFRSLHLEFDELVDALRESSDVVGERIATLGAFPDGRVETVASGSDLATLSEGPLPDRELVASLTGIITEGVNLIRARMDRVEELDVVTADLLHSVVASLEKQLWMIRAQL